jgi:hypothetical protein
VLPVRQWPACGGGRWSGVVSDCAVTAGQAGGGHR